MGIRKHIWLLAMLLWCGALSAQNRQLVQAEYFWDTDPGPGNGIALQAMDGSLNEAVEEVFRNNLTLPATGVHTFNLRVKDYLGNWSTTYRKIIEIKALLPIARGVQVIQAEYFWNTDPGVGNGMPMLALDGNFNESVEGLLANTSTLPSPGAHKLSIRIKDANNQWGAAFSTVVFIQPSLATLRNVKVTAAEYFWDTDPGQGNGTTLLAFDGNFDEAVEVVFRNNLALPSTGSHKLAIRVRDGNNAWGPTFSTAVLIQPTLPANRPVRITAAEYFWDTDPGQGNAISMLAFDGNFNEAMEQVMANISSLPSPGSHKLGIRVKDAANVWGPVFSTVVFVQPSLGAPRPVRVTLAECYFDTDPGQGNATAMVAFDGNFNAALEVLKGGNLPTPVTAGWHALYIRAKDGAQNWGPAFGVVVNIDTTIGGFFALINGNQQLCENQLNNHVYNAAIHAGTSYTWSATGGNIVSGNGTNSVTVNWGAAGTHTLRVIECTANNAYCDTATITVVVADTQVVQRFDTICQGQTIVIGGNPIATAGSYPVVLTNAAGCDSTIITNLTVKPTPTTVLNQTICLGQTFLGYGVSGSYVDTFAAANGCDSLRTLNLTVLQPDTSYRSVTICPGQSFDGYTVAGVYQNQYTNSFGCDSLRILTLTVSSLISTTVNASICAGDTLDGYFSPGAYIDTFATTAGCDSVRTLNLTVLPLASETITATICQGDNVAGYTISGTYLDTLVATNGCDSFRTVVLTVLPSPLSTITQTICQGQSFEGYSSTGVYRDTFAAASGCDSIRTLNLTVAQPDTSYLTITLCAGQNYDGYTTSGNYVDTLATWQGCDSIRYLDLTVWPVFDTTITLTVCEGTVVAGYDSTGIYVDTFATTNGCDSIRTLNLTVQPLSITTNIVTICDGDSVFAENGWQTLAGLYYDTTGFTGTCPDIAITDLRVNPTPPTPVVYGFTDTLNTDIGPYVYQWFYEGDSLQGENGFEVIIDQNGRYAVEVTDSNGCRKMSNLFVVTWVGIGMLDAPLWSLDYYPNPTNGKLTLAAQGPGLVTVTITNSLGQQLQYLSVPNGQSIELDMGHWAAGVYYLQAQQGTSRIIHKVIKVD